ncbi:MAG TPA: gluconate 2-dehydrogenase subunit 3 family protein [Rudaea sp.]|uniref:gluconate 2-dehydrogenase subunit 3 family protein n=1 Tax=Rudaea sp. TaxID=2136325 RepID=UPI002F948336
MRLIDRREAIRRVSVLLGGVAFVGGSRLLTALEKASPAVGETVGEFTAADIAFLDEIAETILPATKTPGAKAAKTGAFMALMVTDSYSPAERVIFREGMRKLDAAMKQANNVTFMAATPQQRLAVLTTLDREQKRVMDAREAAERRKKGLAPLPVEPGMAVSEADASIWAPVHYFRMMKELALLGYFTSEIGCTKAQHYVETPGRFDPCLPYAPGDPAWAAHP